MSTYIGLTALNSHWGTPANTLLLTTGCRQSNSKNGWEKYAAPIDTLRFTTPARLFSAKNFCSSLSVKAFLSLADLLEQHYNFNFSLRFYENLLFPWLLQFTEAVYDRYTSIVQAHLTIGDSCFLTAPVCSPMPQLGTISWIEMTYGNDIFNLRFYSEIISWLGYRQKALPVSPLSAERAVFSNTVRVNCSGWRQKLKKRLNSVIRRGKNFLGKKTHYFYDCSAYGDATQILPEGKSRWLPLEFNLDLGKMRLNSALRSSRLDLGTSELEQLLGYMIPRHLPFGFCEALPGIVTWARSWKISHPGVFVTTRPVWDQTIPLDVFAHCHKIPRAGLQHGGGSFYHDSTQSYELAIYDRFFSWGNTENSLPSAYYLSQKKPGKFESAPLLVANESYRYIFRLVPYYGDGGGVQYHEMRKIFLRLIPEHKRPDIRLYFTEYGWGVQESLKKEFANLNFQNSNTVPFEAAMANTCLMVLDHYSTSLHRAMGTNIPTIIWGDTRYCSEEARPIAEIMKDAEIWHDTPESAAHFYNTLLPENIGSWREASESIHEWWESKKVQGARSAFCNMYARTSPTWPEEWMAAFDQLASDGPRQKALCEA